jgi:hypothetical protein
MDSWDEHRNDDCIGIDASLAKPTTGIDLSAVIPVLVTRIQASPFQTAKTETAKTPSRLRSSGVADYD